MKMRKRLLFCIGSFLSLIILIPTASAQNKKLTYGQVFNQENPKLFAKLPSLKGWIDNSHYLEARKNPNTKLTQLIKIEAESGEESIFLDYNTFVSNFPEDLKPEEFVTNTPDYSSFLYRYRTDLYYYNRSEGKLKRLTAVDGKEENPSFSPDNKWIAYTRNNNLYVLNISSQLEIQLTSDGSETVYNGKSSWVYYEEILGRRSKYKAFWWSPNSDMIAFLRFDDSQVPQFPLYCADGQHGHLEFEYYPQPGDPLPTVRLGVVDVNSQKVTWINRDEVVDEYVAWPVWAPKGQKLYYQWCNRNQNHLKIFQADVRTGNSKQVYEESQKSWVNFFRDMTMLPENAGFILRSDKEGWPNLFHYDLQGKLVSQITKGEMAVSKILLTDVEKNVVYFEGWTDNSTETHIFRAKLNGTGLKKITNIPGIHSGTISPDGNFIYNTHDNINQPQKLDLLNSDGKLIRNIGNKKLSILDEYDLGKSEIFQIETNDGIQLPARWLLPPGFDKNNKYPVIFKVYGGPGRYLVRNSYHRMSDYYLAQNGIIIISVDHRGSSHFGISGKEAMHLNLGKYEVDDLIKAVEWLYKQPFIDSTKIGITGGSYGGYVTALALTYGSEYFTYGIADYSVTDWHLYDATYTERFMDLPLDNPDGYRQSSAITHADKYKGGLMLTHGTMDDNVHMQNTIQLVDKLTDIDKDFELVLIPNSRHGTSYAKRKFATRKKMGFWFRNLLGKELNE
jgi:dipeptidyl-peptidase 4